MVFQDAWHITDHYLVLGYLRGSMPTVYSCYLKKRKLFPMNPQHTLGGVNCLYAVFRGFTLKPPWRYQPQLAWISPETWQVIDAKIVALWIQDGNQGRVRRLSQKI